MSFDYESDSLPIDEWVAGMPDKQRIKELEAELTALREALEKLARLGNGDRYGNSEGNVIAQDALKVLQEKGE